MSLPSVMRLVAHKHAIAIPRQPAAFVPKLACNRDLLVLECAGVFRLFFAEAGDAQTTSTSKDEDECAHSHACMLDVASAPACEQIAWETSPQATAGLFSGHLQSSSARRHPGECASRCHRSHFLFGKHLFRLKDSP
jgi:hypothetical protein